MIQNKQKIVGETALIYTRMARKAGFEASFAGTRLFLQELTAKQIRVINGMLSIAYNAGIETERENHM